MPRHGRTANLWRERFHWGRGRAPPSGAIFAHFRYFQTGRARARCGAAVKTRPLLASLLVATLAVPPQAFAQGPEPVQPLPSLPPPAVAPVPYAPSRSASVPGRTPDADDAAVAVDVPRVVVGNDVVYLKGGGLLRGTLIEAIPNDHATDPAGHGADRPAIPWDRVLRIERAGASATGTPPPPPPPPLSAAPRYAPPPPFTGPTGSAVVHLEGDSIVSLERREGRSWVFACTAPCDAELPLSGLYRVVGPGVRATPSFRLNAQPGEHIVVDATTASKGGFAGGIVLTSVGGFSFLLGALVLLTVATADAADSASGGRHDDSNAGTVGLGMLVGGASSGRGRRPRSHEQPAQQGRSAKMGARSPDHSRDDAWRRVPQWPGRQVGVGPPEGGRSADLRASFLARARPPRRFRIRAPRSSGTIARPARRADLPRQRGADEEDLRGVVHTHKRSITTEPAGPYIVSSALCPR